VIPPKNQSQLRDAVDERRSSRLKKRYFYNKNNELKLVDRVYQ